MLNYEAVLATLVKKEKRKSYVSRKDILVGLKITRECSGWEINKNKMGVGGLYIIILSTSKSYWYTIKLMYKY